jgi:hypothetical protein
LKDETKKKLYHELVERVIKQRDSRVTGEGVSSAFVLLVSALMLSAGVNSLIKDNFISGLFIGGIFFFGASILIAIVAVADYFDTCRWIGELEKLYSEVIE